MKNGKCPKCGGEVFLQEGMGYRNYLRAGFLSALKLQNYICGGCGYVESYVIPEDLQKMRNSLTLVEVVNPSMGASAAGGD